MIGKTEVLELEEKKEELDFKEDPEVLRLEKEKKKKIEKAGKNYFSTLKKMKLHKCSKCDENTWTKGFNSEIEMCAKCSRISREEEPFYVMGEDNLMVPGKPQDWAVGLTDIEKLMVSPILPFMAVYQTRGGSYRMKGNIISFAQNLNQIAEQLPRVAVECITLIVVPRGSDLTTLDESTKKKLTVRREKIHSFLINAKRSNLPGFEVIEINTDLINSLPVNGVPPIPVTEEDSDSQMVNNSPNHEIPDEVEDIEQDYECFVPVDENRPRDCDSIRMSDLSDSPVSEYNTLYLGTKCFPYLFSNGGRGDPFNGRRQKSVTLEKCVRHLLNVSYPDSTGKEVFLFASDSRFCFWSHNIITRANLMKKTNWYFRNHESLKSMTLDDIKKELNESGDRMSSIVRQLSRISGDIKGTDGYWWRRYQELKSLCEQSGLPTVFWTVSFADLHDHYFHRIIGSDGEPLRERRKSLSGHPHLASHYFSQKMNNFVNFIFGTVMESQWDWWRVEFQQRGTGHVHGCSKLKDDPGIVELCLEVYRGRNSSERQVMEQGKESEDKLIKYVDSLVSSWNPLDDPDDFKYDPNVHPCSVPRSVHHPLNETEKSCLSDLVNSCQRHTRCGNYCMRDQPDGTKKCRFGFPHDLCDQTRLDIDDSDPANLKFEIKTRRNDPLLNTFNEHQVMAAGSNVDFTFVVSKDAFLKYIAKYISKCEKKSDRVKKTMEHCRKKVNSSTSSMSALRKISFASMAQRDISHQESVWELQNLPLFHCPKTTFVSVNFGNGRMMNIRTGQTKGNIFDDYSDRGESLNDLNFFDWARDIRPSPTERVILVWKCQPSKNRNKLGWLKCEMVKYRPWRGVMENSWNDLADQQSMINWLCENEFMDIELDPSTVDESEILDNPVDPSDQVIPDYMRLVNPDSVSHMNDEEDDEVKIEWATTYDFSQDLPVLSEYDKIRVPTFIRDSRESKVDNIEILSDENLDVIRRTPGQKDILDLVVNHYEEWKNNKEIPPKYILLLGTAGTGKSFVIKGLKTILKNNIIVCATTGVAANNIDGSTYHSLLGISGTKRFKSPLEPGSKLTCLQERVNPAVHCFILVDEISMMSQRDLLKFDLRLRDCSGKLDLPFGGFSVILVGDFMQLPPVGGPPLYKNNDSDGFSLYRLFTYVVILSVVKRQNGEEQRRFREGLKRLQDGIITRDDYEYFMTRSTDRVRLSNPVRLFCTNKEVNRLNSIGVSTQANPVCLITSRDSKPSSVSKNWRDMGNLHRDLYLAKDVKVMLTTNLFTEGGLTNGSVGFVHSVFHSEDKSPPELPVCVFVKFPGYKGPQFFGGDELKDVIPVCPVTRSGDKPSYGLRTQVPLTLGFAMTIHKSQGLSLDEVEIDIGKKEMSSGVTFVGFSRVKKFEGLSVKPFSWSRYQSIGGKPTIEERKKEYVRLNGMKINQ